MTKNLKTGFIGCYLEKTFECSPKMLSITAGVSEPSNFSSEKMAYRQMAENITAQAQLPAQELSDRLQKVNAQLQPLRDELEDLATRWMEVAGEHLLCVYAQELQSVKYPDSTLNKWVDHPEPHGYFKIEDISNHAFCGQIRVLEHDYAATEKIWYVAYDVCVNLPKCVNVIDVGRRELNKWEDALAYIAKIKADLSKTYFSSIDPVIPAEHRSKFLLHGAELPGYTYEPEKENTEEEL